MYLTMNYKEEREKNVTDVTTKLFRIKTRAHLDDFKVSDAARHVEQRLAGDVTQVEVERHLELLVAVAKRLQVRLRVRELEEQLEDGRVPVHGRGVKRRPPFHRQRRSQVRKLLEQDLDHLLPAVVGGDVERRVLRDWVNSAIGAAVEKKEHHLR